MYYSGTLLQVTAYLKVVKVRRIYDSENTLTDKYIFIKQD